ncbi:MAG: DUF6445 family protein [Pseudomonadota bacterium]
MLPSLMVIDDFLDNPLAAREQALKLGYPTGTQRGNYAGTTSERPLKISQVSESVSKRVNYRLKGADGTLHMHTRLTLRGDKGRTGVHIDPCYYSGILYLSLPEHCKGGTDFYEHRKTKLDRVPNRPADLMAAGYPSVNAFVEGVVNKDTFRAERWTRAMRIPARFNRLILFSPWMFHNAGPGFGTSLQDGRLVCLLFLSAAD